MSTVQAFVVGGGRDAANNYFSSVVTLHPGAPAWVPLASLPRALVGARASVVSGKMRVTGGYYGRSEVMIGNSFRFSTTLVLPCFSRF